MQYIYISSNRSRPNESKYGFTTRLKRKLDSHEQFSYPTLYDHLYEVEETREYILHNFNEYDKIISSSIDKDNIFKYERIHKCELPNLRHVQPYLLVNGGGQELIYSNQIDLLDKVIREDLPKFGLKINKLSDEKVEEINEINKRDTYEHKQQEQNKISIYLDTLISNVRTPIVQNEKGEILPLSDSIEKRQYQSDCEHTAITHFATNDKGILNWCCGLGKTIMSLIISSHYVKNYLLIGVPSVLLLNQWLQVISMIGYYDNFPIFTLCSKCPSNIKSLDITTNKQDGDLTTWKNTHSHGIVISLYASSNKLLHTDFTFDFGINDECHHLCRWKENESKRKYTDILQLPITKQLSLTATMKQLTNNNVIDNSDTDVFGSVIDKKTVSWAIENDYITDYDIVSLNIKEDDLEEIIESLKLEIKNKELFLAAYMTLKAFEIYANRFTHTLIYTHNTDNADTIKTYIDLIIRSNIISISTKNIYNQSLHSKSTCDNMDKINIQNEIENFSTSDFGIISCVYIFGEGFDLPKLSGVVFSQNMESEIRIVQSVLRANRKDKNNKDKKAMVIIPFIDHDTWIPKNEEKNSFGKLRTIIKALRNEDKNIEQKIRAPRLKKRRPSPNPHPHLHSRIQLTLSEENDQTNKIKLRLRKSDSLGGDDIAHTKKMIASLGGKENKSDTSEQDYYNKCNQCNDLFSKEDMEEILMKKNKDFLDLYYERETIPPFEEFKTYITENSITMEQYKIMDTLPYPDLGDLEFYSNYNLSSFWLGNIDDPLDF